MFPSTKLRPLELFTTLNQPPPHPPPGANPRVPHFRLHVSPSLLRLPVMPHETSPLLSKNDDCVEYGLPTKIETSIYDRFTPQRKRMILVLISLAGMIPREYPASALVMYRFPPLADFECGPCSQCLLLARSCHVFPRFLATYVRREPSSSKLFHHNILPCARHSKLNLGIFH